jgi:uncharacterized protein with von Willebrand factor type A (vWA) domain
MMVVCKDRLDRIKNSERIGVEAVAAVEADIARLLSGKSYNELASLQRQIQEKLTSREPIDTDYWESLLKKLLVWKAKVFMSALWFSVDFSPVTQANLKSLHEVVVRNRLEQLRKRQRDEALQAQEELLAGVAKSASSGSKVIAGTTAGILSEPVSTDLIEEYDRAMSPPVIDITKLPAEDRQIDILTAKEDLRNLVCPSSTFQKG